MGSRTLWASGWGVGGSVLTGTEVGRAQALLTKDTKLRVTEQPAHKPAAAGLESRLPGSPWTQDALHPFQEQSFVTAQGRSVAPQDVNSGSVL